MELTYGDSLQEFARFLTAEGLYVFTINGFPYGQFHATAVKANVYRPDWRTPQRREYTMLLAARSVCPVGQCLFRTVYLSFIRVFSQL